MHIPKIIHHIGPSNKSMWHPLWLKCQNSWLKIFGDFEYKFWNDEHDIDNLVKNNYPEYWEMYRNLPVHIMKIDFARFCLLHKYGGIYGDLDIFVYKNFYNELTNEVCLMPAPYGSQALNGDNLIENALMASIPNHNFFQKCMKESKDIFQTVVSKKNIQFPLSLFDQIMVGNLAGPSLVSKVYSKFNTNIKILNAKTFNNHGLSYNDSFFTKHLLTGVWGKETLKSISYNDYINEVSKFVDLKDVTVDNFDFYKDYTNGGFLK